MGTEFFDAFNATLPAFESMFGESWTFNGAEYPAIAVDVIAGHTMMMRGGEIDTSAVKIWVRLEIFQASGVTEDDIINVRGRDFLLRSINDSGDDVREFECAPPQIETWGAGLGRAS